MEKVVVLSGGKSSEREISLRSGAAVAKSLKENGFEVVTLDPADKRFAPRILEIADVYSVFIALHGPGGEDGTIQGFLETLGFPYTGSGVLASSLALDKILAKRLFISAGLPTPPFCPPVFFPLVSKPARSGSTIGISIVKKEEDLEAALKEARRYDNQVLMEQYISGTEVTVSILGNENPRVLPSIEIVPASGFYDYQAKYAPGGSKHIIPPRLPEEWVSKTEEVVLKAHKLLGCRGLSRSEVIIDKEGNPYILDVNTIPGFTETSLFPESARAAGISFNELTLKLIELSRLRGC
ncbi:MAG: D-alanine--D-alanine ligase [Candidatus Omnitrophota bacterium]